MNSKTFRRSLALACVICFVWGFAGAKEGPKEGTKKQTLTKTTGDPFRQVLNINNFMTWMAANGNGNNPPSQGGDGSAYPRGTRWVIYQDGVVWGAKAYLDNTHTTPAPNQVIRVGGGTYNVGNQAGAIIGTGASAVAEDANLPLVRIFRIRRDYKQMTADDLAKDAAEFNEGSVSTVTAAQIAEIQANYDLDWKEWPVSKGAPYVERNGVAGYQAPPDFNYDANAGPLFTTDSLISGNYDEPGLAGADPNSPADQVIWTVANDLNASTNQAFAGSDPLGLEMQMTMWGYKRADALGQLYFKLIKLINKGGVDIGGGNKGSFYLDSMFVCQWSDPDLGNYSDDLCGVDSVLSLGFVYNGNASDQEFAQFNLPPPAVGYDFLQGPAVPSTGDSAVFGLKIVHDKKNLPLTSFAYFSAGSGISDPPFTYEGALRWWRMLQGFVPDPSTAPWRLYPFPPGVAQTVYPLSGEPSTRTGFLDGQGTIYSLVAGDRRIVLNSGPFQLAPGDTQEIVVGTVGGMGADRLSSVAVMKFNDRFVQNTYNALFQVPRPPDAPKVTVGEMDGKIVLEWASDPAAVAKTEDVVNNPGAYTFEGYNVYQFSSASGTLADAKRIVTFDKATDPTVVLDEQFDQGSGQILQLPVQYGTNSGITRWFQFDRDYINDVGKLYNGQEYYIAVTAYSIATTPGFLPAVLESAPQVLTVRPRMPFGQIVETQIGDTLTVSHTGLSDGFVTPLVINPMALNGHNYSVRFDTTGGTTTWYMRDETAGTNKLIGQTNQSNDDNYLIIDGMQVKVSGPPPGLKVDAWDWPSGSRFLTWAGGASGLGLEEFAGAVGWASPRLFYGDGHMVVTSTELKAIEIRFAATTDDKGTFDVNDPNASYGYRYGRGFASAPADPAYAPFIVNAAGSYAYQDFTVSVPLAVYDMDATPPRRLAVGFLENNQPPTAGVPADERVNGRYWPPFYNDGDNTASTGPREWLFIFDETYSTTPNATYQAEIIGGDHRVMYWATWARRNDNPWAAGNVMTLTPNRPNFVTDVFSFTATAPTGGAAVEVASVKDVNVFPNPYYAFNAAETNRLVRFVTFSNLPAKAKVRIFNLAGQPIRTLEKDDASQFLRWDLTNQDNFPVASGMYLAYVELTMPTDGSVQTKVLKLAIIQEQEILNVY